jgi:CRP/FNR family transcriptional regulator, cyclic AMP receptor protein
MTSVPTKPSIAAPTGKLKILSANPLFKNFEPSIIDRILSRAVIRKIKKGTVLFRKGDIGSTLYAVCAGSVRISVPSEQGQDAIFNVIPSGELFGEIALLDGGPRTADAVAVEDSELMIIDRRDFIPMVRENPDVAMKLIELVCARLRRTSEQVEDIMFLGLPGRLAKALLQLHSQPAAGPSHAIRVTQRDLSQMIGVSRESVNKLLRDWQRHGWVKLQRGGLIVVSHKAVGELVASPD